MKTDHWVCPYCCASNRKTYLHGEIAARLPDGKVLLETTHPDGCPKCEGDVDGREILAGQHDAWLPAFGRLGTMMFVGCLCWGIATVTSIFFIGGSLLETWPAAAFGAVLGMVIRTD